MCVVVQNKVAAPWIFSRGSTIPAHVLYAWASCLSYMLHAACYMLHATHAACAQAQHSMEVDLFPWLHVTTQYWEIGPQHHLDSW